MIWEHFREQFNQGEPSTTFLLTEEFEGPNGPPWDERYEVFVTDNNAALIFGNSQFIMDIVTQETRSSKWTAWGFRRRNIGFDSIAFQRGKLSCCDCGNMTQRPYLSMRMRVRAPHHGAFVLNDHIVSFNPGIS